jgi:RHS repeat-associated protein
MNSTNMLGSRFLLGLFLALNAPLAKALAVKTVTFYYTDQLGTTLATADANGNVLSVSDYRPYGSQALGSPENGPGYTGHVNDEDSGLVYMQARYFDPSFGRFLSVDPKIADPGSLDTFARFSYASGNPVTNVDPDGRQTWCSPDTCGAREILALSRQATYIRDNFDLVAEAKIAGGVGVGIKYNISSNKGDVSLYPAAIGREVSMYFQAKTPIVIPLVDKPMDSKMAIGWGGGLDLGAIIKLGVDVDFNPGGTLELTPKAGTGYGVFGQFAPSISLFQWSNAKDRDKSLQVTPSQGSVRDEGRSSAADPGSAYGRRGLPTL